MFTLTHQRINSSKNHSRAVYGNLNLASPPHHCACARFSFRLPFVAAHF